MEKGEPQITLGGVFGESQVLGDKRVVEAQFVPQGLTLGRCDPFAHHVPNRIADLVFDGETNQADDQHDEDGLGNAPNDKSDHRCGSRYKKSKFRSQEPE